MIRWHVYTVLGLAAVVGVNLGMLWRLKERRSMIRYVRLQAIAWITLMSMILFSGAAVMAFLHRGFSLKIFVMVMAAVMLSLLEFRRHLATVRLQGGHGCFERLRSKMMRYYLFELLWIGMMVALTPMIR